MATPTPVFPGAVATDEQLKVANNLITGKLRVSVDAANTILFVDSVAGFAANMLVSIDKEIIAIAAVTASPNPALLVDSGGRGFDGTTATAHAAGAKVAVYIDAWHHNVLAAEVKAIEEFIGPSGQNVTSGIAVPACSYNFDRQTPGGNLIAGANSVVLSPVPAGVNGSDTNHYLYVDQGTGTAEAVLIAGGSAVAGAPSGTIIVNCANPHSGAWRIGSATGGMQEALIAAPPAVPVMVTCAMTVQAPTTLGRPVAIIGTPGASIAGGTPSSVFIVASDDCTIRGCTILAGASTYGIRNSGNHKRIIIAENRITGSDVAIKFDAGSELLIESNHISSVRATGIDCGIDVTISYVRILNNYVSCVGSTALNGGGIGCWGSHTVIANNIVIIGGNQDQGIVWINHPGVGVTNGLIANNFVEFVAAGGFEGIGIGSATNFAVVGNVIKVSVSLTGPAACYGIEVNNSSNGVISNNTMMLNNPATPAAGIQLESTVNVITSNNVIRGYGNNASSAGINLTHTSTTNPAGGALTGNIVSANTITQTNPAATASAIRVETLVGGSADNNRFTGNIINGTTAAGMTGIKITNSSSATMTGLSIAGNDFNSCNIPFSVAPNASIAIAGGNKGVDDVIGSVPESSPITWPINPNFVITGTGPAIGQIVTTNLVKGTRGTLRTTGGAVSFSTGGSGVGSDGITVQNKLYQWMFDGTFVYISGPGF